MENELRVSYLRNNANTGAGNFQFPGLDQFPNLTIDELNGLQIGPDRIRHPAKSRTTPSSRTTSPRRGRHTFKAGFNMTDMVIAGYFIQRARGDYEYSTLGQICRT